MPSWQRYLRSSNSPSGGTKLTTWRAASPVRPPSPPPPLLYTSPSHRALTPQIPLRLSTVPIVKAPASPSAASSRAEAPPSIKSAVQRPPHADCPCQATPINPWAPRTSASSRHNAVVKSGTALLAHTVRGTSEEAALLCPSSNSRTFSVSNRPRFTQGWKVMELSSSLSFRPSFRSGIPERKHFIRIWPATSQRSTLPAQHATAKHHGGEGEAS